MLDSTDTAAARAFLLGSVQPMGTTIPAAHAFIAADDLDIAMKTSDALPAAVLGNLVRAREFWSTIYSTAFDDDRVLHAVARRLDVSPEDVAGRRAGELFAALIRSRTD